MLSIKAQITYKTILQLDFQIDFGKEEIISI